MKQEPSAVKLGISVVYGGEDVNWASHLKSIHVPQSY